jgi:D-alanyl-lipoteichoic acid acyltransferase DltB (MBOAT superfamily)
MVIAFFSFYQQSPIFTLGIIFVVIVGYLLYKKRKNKHKSIRTPYIGQGIRSGKYEKILSLLVFTQLMNTKNFSKDSSPPASVRTSSLKDKKYESDAPRGLNLKDMIMDLLQEE